MTTDETPLPPRIEPPLIPPIIDVLSAPPPLPAMPPADVPAPGRISPVVWLGLGIFVCVSILGFFVPGEFGNFLQASLEPAPFALLCALAYLGMERPWARISARVWLGCLLMLAVAFVAMVSYLGLVRDWSRPDRFPPVLDEGGGLNLAIVTGMAMLGATAVFLARWRWLRRFAGCDENSSLHALALGAVVSLSVICLIPLLILGEPPILQWLIKMAAAGETLDAGRGPAGLLRDQFYGLSWMFLAAVFAVGFGVRRNWQEALARLGLLRPTRRQLGLAVGLTAMLLGVMYGVDEGIGWLWRRMDWPSTNEEAVNKLFSFAFSLPGAVVIGITAGVGEEAAVRGVLQPRLGILISNLFFTSLHALQYNWDGLLSVFCVGMVLGLIRRQTNTTVSAIVHGGYDFVLLLYATYAHGG